MKMKYMLLLGLGARRLSVLWRLGIGVASYIHKKLKIQGLAPSNPLWDAPNILLELRRASNMRAHMAYTLHYKPSPQQYPQIS